MEEEVLENTPESFEKLINETNEYKEKFLKASADSINIKNRLEKEKSQAVKYSNFHFAEDLLETLDNFENMMTIDMPEEIKNGVTLVQESLFKTLKKHNVVECHTETFDPNVHEAVSTIKDGKEPKSISQVLRKGYMFEDRLLRPAMVVVSG